MQIEPSRLPCRWARNHGTAWPHRPTLQGLIANGCCRNEIFSDVFVTLGCVRKGLPAHNADQTFVIWIEDTGSGVSGRVHITYHSRKLVSQRKGSTCGATMWDRVACPASTTMTGSPGQKRGPS